MSEEKPSGGSQPQQSFGSAPGSGEQSFGSAPDPAPQPPAPQPPAPQPPTPQPPDAPPSATEPPPAAPAAPAPQPPAAPAQPAGDQSFGGAPQPPAPQPPAQGGETFGEAPPPPPTAPPPKKRLGWLRVVGGIILALVLLCLVGAFVLVRFVNADPLRNLSVGDCLADVPTVSEGENRQVTNARKVDCSDPAATHRVEARYDDRTPDEAAGLCASHPNANFVITPDRAGDARGYVLCLSTVGE